MEVLELDKLLALFSLAALGFVLRYFYRSQLKEKKEETAELLLWSLVLSAVVGVVFQSFGWPISQNLARSCAHLPPVGPLTELQRKALNNSSRTLCLIFNLGYAGLIGHVVGGLRKGWILSERQYERLNEIHRHKKKPKRFVRIWARIRMSVSGVFGSSLKHYDWLLLEYLDQHCKNQYIVVSFCDGSSIMGFFQFGEKTDVTDSCLLLKYPRPFDAKTKLFEAPTSKFLLLNLAEVRSIAVTPSDELQNRG